MKISILVAVLVVLILSPKIALALPTAKATLLVVDSENIPMKGVEARLNFSKPKSSGWGSTPYGLKGTTDDEGIYVDSGATERLMFYGASAEGYYNSSHKYTAFTGVSGIIGFRKWQPWNPTLTVVLKKKINPIPMYAYFTGMIPFPDTGDSIGYDLVKHDWVSPHGKGTTADFLFKLKGEFRSMKDSNVIFSLDFINEADGIQPFSEEKSQGSNFISGHHAPLTGYKPHLMQSRINVPGELSKTSYNNADDYNYYFRIRCDGNDESTCLYGKIYNRIEFAARGFLSFSYYLNPTLGDTNVEFDPKRNLFKNLDNEVKKP